MPNSPAAITRAASAALALACCLPASAAAQAPVQAAEPPTSTPVLQGGGASVLASAAAALPSDDSLVRVTKRQLTVAPGSRALVRARAKDQTINVKLRTGRHGKVIDRARVGAGKKFHVSGRARPGEKLWLTAERVGGPGEQAIAIGSVRRLRPAVASWYGPGLYGNRTACGQTLTPGLRGVAHKRLPCGTRLTVRYGGKSTRATVIDRGPFHGNREFDLTNATARAIGFRHVGRVWVSR